MQRAKQKLGQEGERRAEEYLVAQGWQLLASNYRCKYGEIDRVFRKGEWVIFVEVKTRRTFTYGLPREAVDARKQKQIFQSALHFIQEHQLGHLSFRFDVVEVLFLPRTRVQIRHIPNAFEPENPVDWGF